MIKTLAITIPALVAVSFLGFKTGSRFGTWLYDTHLAPRLSPSAEQQLDDYSEALRKNNNSR